MKKDPQSRKWCGTVNNPLEKNLDRETILKKLQQLKSAVYGCLADELGLEEQTPHTHFFVACSSPVRFSTMQNLFNKNAHLETAHGSAQQNYEYVTKTGKWQDDEKRGSIVEDSFMEFGEMPIERQGGLNIESAIIERILDGASNASIIREFPEYLRGMRDVDYIRQTLRADESRECWRDLETVYIWGKTETGKTRFVMDGHGYSNVYAVNNYKHPFDGYTGESVMLFDEFNSGIRIQDMNNYLDGYPIALPARYSNKQACYDKVFIISNLDLREQYRLEQQTQPEVWAAFIRRIHKVIKFMPDGTRQEYDAQDYVKNITSWTELPKGYPTPWSSKGVG